MQAKNLEWTAIIPARAGSKGLENKNTRILNGIPLYLRTVIQAKAAGATRIILSTNINEIINKPFELDATIDVRREDLCSDTADMESVLQYLCERYKLTGFAVLLQPTTPLRRLADIRAAIELYLKNDYTLVLSVSKVDSTPLKYGLLSGSQFIPISDSKYCFYNRQNLPSLYKPNGGIFVFDAEDFAISGKFSTKSIGAICMPECLSIDIDNENDLAICENYIREEKWNANL